jgi:hypothetical protein
MFDFDATFLEIAVPLQREVRRSVTLSWAANEIGVDICPIFV